MKETILWIVFFGGKMKSRKVWVCLICAFIVLLFVFNIRFSAIYSLPEGFLASRDEVEKSSCNNYFGNFVTANLESSSEPVSTDETVEGYIVFKLFGFIPIRKVKVLSVTEEEVYVGGVPLGLSINTKGGIVITEKMVNGELGYMATEKSVKLQEGDLITAVNGQEVESLDGLCQLVENSETENIDITFLRSNKLLNANIKAIRDKDTGKYKLGLWVKDDVSGIGTLTYINKNTNKFGALGHAITENKNQVPVCEGQVFECKLLGIDKGEHNEPGQLRCMFSDNDKIKGNVYKNTKYGIFGEIEDSENLIDQNLSMQIGGRLSVSPGKAYIVSSVSGIREEYEIEIIKASYQSKMDDKSIVFRVKDKRLINLTGGIVQGMSGSPIIQNGKLVGAVTHVFTSDPTKGYGIYSDWMVLSES